ncbi:Membrane domain of membrane-anchored glycerophosphoryl diester phosphodiesterase [Staphylococcus petrasii]|uniref:Glycerophosphodiester phosphodiesterase family protein n=1 Tax=Staphylococcus petrasii TaxID=1276936 RepID=A0A380G424_9STAP|nr:glycerophosphodiester phosphodiesterase family protein [Staphylococcus petrasii]PNZ27834.1 hypothetical protein CD137_08035 [Staphylococcus petrasii]TGE12326.1 glycerophosphodiester phosphodiesterase family protein [Staphylococcus petrasii]TGE17943.1 glycerophosphodiester phosphodiesterase family protein [Staphylococcus petrasii]SUM45226.1 Membrane domain of membrane-anchored glycerophosphoryl diester phosphodiesterase [Staphylococcus petrasii]
MTYRHRLDKLLLSDKPLLVSHQGMAGGNIVNNSMAAFENAIKQGASFIELDITKTLDDVFYIMHVNEEPIRIHSDKLIKEMTSEEVEQHQLLNMNMQPVTNVPKLRDIMNGFTKYPDIMLHIDHITKWDSLILNELNHYQSQLSQFIIKIDIDSPSTVEAICNHETPFMTIFIVKNIEEVDVALQLIDKVNVVGLEFVFEHEDDTHIQPSVINKVKALGLFTLANSMRLNEETTINAELDDDISLLDHPDKGWGKLLAMNFDMIQTDWILPLKQYIESKQ